MEELKQFKTLEEVLNFDDIEEYYDDDSKFSLELSNGLTLYDFEEMIRALGLENFYFKQHETKLEIYIDSRNVKLSSWLKLFEYNCNCGGELIETHSRIIDSSEIQSGLFLLEW